MCNIWENPTDKKREITAKELEFLPNFKTVNITGGEPFVRKDLDEIVEVMSRKSKEVVISTSGWHTGRILELAKRFPNIGIRVSIEGLSVNNDDLRGRNGGFDRAIKTLLGLKQMGIKNIGFGITVSNNNSDDLLPLYELSHSLGFEFSTATFHNSFYFHKNDNEVLNKDVVVTNFEKLINRLMSESKPKSWFRALFNLGLVNYIKGKPRMLPCEAGSTNFFIYPYGDVFPCNGLEEKYWLESMGNIRDYDSFDELWNSKQSKKVREMVRVCPKNCWMVGTAAPVIKKYIWKTGPWVVKNKIASLLGKKISIENIPTFPVGQDPKQGNLLADNVNEIADRNFKIKEVPIRFSGDFDEDNVLVAASDSSVKQAKELG
jgi:radical SAM protein with 4Fe4S-binding SPASM domain